MNKPKTNNEIQAAKQATNKPAISSWAIRLALAVIWVCIYVPIIWGMEYATSFGKVVGFSALAIGAAAVLIPKSVLGKKGWEYAIYVFFALCATAIIRRFQ
jgi:hypothetical protein